MRYLLLAVFMFLVACPGAAKYPTIDTRVGARTVLIALASAVRATADVCLDEVKTEAANASEKNDPALLANAIKFGESCRDTLLPVQHAILDASDAVDAWTGAADEVATGKVACAVASFLDQGVLVEKLLASVKALPPVEYADAKALTAFSATLARAACK